MKKAIIITSSAILLLAIALCLYMLNGCQKNVEPIDEFVSNFIGIGQVLNEETEMPIENVNIKLEGTNRTFVPNKDGSFSFENLDIGSHKLIVSSEGYVTTTSEITVTPIAVYSTSIFLRKIQDYKLINKTGGEIISSIDDGRYFSITIPSGSLEEEISISLTPIEGITLGRLSEISNLQDNDVDGLHNIRMSIANADVIIKGATTLKTPISLSCLLPIKKEYNSKILVRLYDVQTLNLLEDSLYAVIGIDGKSATLNINKSGRYSFGDESLNSLGLPFSRTECDDCEEIKSIESQNGVLIVPNYVKINGTPDNYSCNFIVGIAERILGYPLDKSYNIYCRIPDVVDINAISIANKSDLKSTELGTLCGFWSWFFCQSCSNIIGPTSCPSGYTLKSEIVSSSVVNCSSASIDGISGNDGQRVITTLKTSCHKGGSGN